MSRGVTVEWGRYGKRSRATGDYALLDTGGRHLTADDYERLFMDFAAGTPPKKAHSAGEALPWVVTAYTRDRDGANWVVLSLIRQEPIGDKDHRPVNSTHFFCFPFADVQQHAMGYRALFDQIRDWWPEQSMDGAVMPEGHNTSVQDHAAKIEIYDFRKIACVASMLLSSADEATGRKIRGVSIVDAEDLVLEARLEIIDAVLALLPFGLRTRLAAGAWTDKKDHPFLLSFSRRAGSDRVELHWFPLQTGPRPDPDITQPTASMLPDEPSRSYFETLLYLHEKRGFTTEQIVKYLAADAKARDVNERVDVIDYLKGIDKVHVVWERACSAKNYDAGLVAEVRSLLTHRDKTPIPDDYLEDLGDHLVFFGELENLDADADTVAGIAKTNEEVVATIIKRMRQPTAEADRLLSAYEPRLEQVGKSDVLYCALVAAVGQGGLSALVPRISAAIRDRYAEAPPSTELTQALGAAPSVVLDLFDRAVAALPPRADPADSADSTAKPPPWAQEIRNWLSWLAEPEGNVNGHIETFHKALEPPGVFDYDEVRALAPGGGAAKDHRATLLRLAERADRLEALLDPVVTSLMNSLHVDDPAETSLIDQEHHTADDDARLAAEVEEWISLLRRLAPEEATARAMTDLAILALGELPALPPAGSGFDAYQKVFFDHWSKSDERVRRILAPRLVDWCTSQGALSTVACDIVAGTVLEDALHGSGWAEEERLRLGAAIVNMLGSSDLDLRGVQLAWKAACSTHRSQARRIFSEWLGRRRPDIHLRELATLFAMACLVEIEPHRCLDEVVASPQKNLDGYRSVRLTLMYFSSEARTLGVPHDRFADACEQVRRALFGNMGISVEEDYCDAVSKNFLHQISILSADLDMINGFTGPERSWAQAEAQRIVDYFGSDDTKS